MRRHLITQFPIEEQAYMVLCWLKENPKFLMEPGFFQIVKKCKEILKGTDWEKPIVDREIIESPTGRVDFGELDQPYDFKDGIKFESWQQRLEK